MIGSRYFTANPFEFDAGGVPLAGGQLFFYLSGTSAKVPTYNDVSLTVPNTNPIIADANGRFGSIFLSPNYTYKVQLWTAPTVLNPQGAQIWSEDPVGSESGGGTPAIIGEIRAYAGTAASIPANWALCYGQAVSRTSYPDLFTALGTTWGAGDSTTTFNLPDLRGRGLFGLDNMGGTSAARITSGVSGVSGDTLGATGGDEHSQTDTLSAATSVTSVDSGHTHATTAVTSPISAGGSGIGGGVGYTWPAAAISIGYANITATATTTVTSALLGSSQNLPPAAIVVYIIYLGPISGGDGSLTVTDGLTAVINVGTLDFTSGMKLTAGSPGVADLSAGGVVDGLTGAGTNQATALQLDAWVNVIASAPANTGFVLQTDISAGTVVVQNMDAVNNATVYPPVGAQINGLGTNVPFVIGSNGARISFSTSSPSTQWYAG